jgi:hypothetical protein
MKKPWFIFVAVLSCISLASVQAQTGGRRGGVGIPMPRGPVLSGAMAKVFGDNSAFTATVEFQGPEASGRGPLRGKMSFDSGKSRFEMDMSEMGGASGAAQMKAMGMDKMVMIARPDRKVNYMVYPGLKGYVETAIDNPELSKPESAYKVEVTELGKETVDGHPCVKNQVTVTDDQGKKNEFVLWNASDLKKFPVKLESSREAQKYTMLFKDVKLAKPEATELEPPADFKKHESMMSMMMERMGGGMGMPPR